MIKSPLRYPGGKSKAVKFLMQFVPSFLEFREIFFGGGSLSFFLNQQFPERIFKASDLNYELYCFWSQLKNNSSVLIENVQQFFNEVKHNAQSTPETGKDIFNMLVKRRNSNLTELQRAADFFILNRITFSGVVDSGGFSQKSFEARFTQTSIERLIAAASVVKNIAFFCEDFSILLNEPGKNVLVFLDPPYYAATKSKLYGKKGILHANFNHENLFSALKNSPHNWLLTYDNSTYIKDLYKDYFQLEWQLQYGMTNKPLGEGLKNELLIANYNLSVPG